jgi:hypothetical protein
MHRRALMGDDRDMIIGELREGFRSLLERLKRQDDISLIRDQQREIDKREAIQERTKQHDENQRDLKDIRDKATHTYDMASVAFNWTIERAPVLITQVDDIEKRVEKLERTEEVEDAESRGKKIAFAMVGAALGVLSTILALASGAADFIKRALQGTP